MNSDNNEKKEVNNKGKMYAIVIIIAGLLYSMYDAINGIIEKNLWSALPNLIMVGIIASIIFIYFKKNP